MLRAIRPNHGGCSNGASCRSERPAKEGERFTAPDCRICPLVFAASVNKQSDLVVMPGRDRERNRKIPTAHDVASNSAYDADDGLDLQRAIL